MCWLRATAASGWSCGTYLIYGVQTLQRRILAQIPPDLVVKFQTIDIVEVICAFSQRRRTLLGWGATGNHGVRRSPELWPLGLPLNPVESAFPKALLDLFGQLHSPAALLAPHGAVWARA